MYNLETSNLATLTNTIHTEGNTMFQRNVPKLGTYNFTILPATQYLGTLLGYLKRHGVTVTRERPYDVPPDVAGSYAHHIKTIYTDPSQSDTIRGHALNHESCHFVDHIQNEYIYMPGRNAELVAEAANFLVLKRFGVDPSPMSVPYLYYFEREFMDFRTLIMGEGDVTIMDLKDRILGVADALISVMSV